MCIRDRPSFAHGQARATVPRERWLPIAVGALGVLLALQLLLADRARLAGDAHWLSLIHIEMCIRDSRSTGRPREPRPVPRCPLR